MCYTDSWLWARTSPAWIFQPRRVQVVGESTPLVKSWASTVLPMIRFMVIWRSPTTRQRVRRLWQQARLGEAERSSSQRTFGRCFSSDRPWADLDSWIGNERLEPAQIPEWRVGAFHAPL